MPNFMLNDDHRSSFVNAVTSLTQVRVDLVEKDFPLTVAEIEQGLMPEHMRGLYNQLKKLGAENLKDTYNPAFFLLGEGFDRAMAVRTNLGTKRVWYTYEAQDSGWGASEAIRRAATDRDKKLALNLAVLTEEKLAKLQKWANAALQEHRQQELCKQTVSKFLSQPSGHSVAHVITRWPALKLVFDELDKNHWSRRGTNSWRDRVNQVPRARDRWDWDRADATTWEWREKNVRIMAVVDEMIVGASMLPREPKMAGRLGQERPIVASILDWRRNMGETI